MLSTSRKTDYFVSHFLLLENQTTFVLCSATSVLRISLTCCFLPRSVSPSRSSLLNAVHNFQLYDILADRRTGNKTCKYAIVYKYGRVLQLPHLNVTVRKGKEIANTGNTSVLFDYRSTRPHHFLKRFVSRFACCCWVAAGLLAPHDRWSLLSQAHSFALQLMITNVFPRTLYWHRNIFTLLHGIDQRYLCVLKERLYDS